ncbi:hypothetical protein [Ancylobacter terrae]|uniref:hypothetical protein n=1 Tax=Ancylobacter sp. sgz301288 TaxID=3342077 RepID=UPI00385CE095
MFASVPARADDCPAIFKAFETLMKTSTYSQNIAMKEMSLRSIVMGDVIYMNSDGTWTKVALKPGGRQEMLKQFVPDGSHLKECAKVGTESIGGKAMTIYRYVPPVPKGMEGLPGAGVPQKLWVGDSDGLPHRLTTDAMEMTISFEPVTAPIP